MARICVVCSNAHHHSIDAELVNGRSVRTIASAFGLDHRAVHRHARNHLPLALQAAAAVHLAQIDGNAVARSPSIEGAASERTNFLPASPRSRRSINISGATPAAPLQPVAISPAPDPEPTASTPPASPLGLLALAHDLRDRALGILASAEAAGDQKTALAAIREARGMLEALSRLEPQHGAVAAVSLSESAEWQRVRAALLTALAPHPDARLAVATALVSADLLT